MSERPILFSGPMVRAILEGRKTQTRRVMKPQPPKVSAPVSWMPWEAGVTAYKPGSWGRYVEGTPPGCWGLDFTSRCPYGAPGDRLWVRERWQTTANVDDLSPTQIGQKAIDAGFDRPWAPVWYCDGVYNNAVPEAETRPDRGNWGGRSMRLRPSIHMPRWASRISLEVTEIRIEKVCAITNNDALAEGCTGWNPPDGHEEPREDFAKLWDEINAKRGYPWSDNPWVWVVGFKVEPR